jgi:hypothetical protein
MLQNPELGPYLQCGLLGGGRASLVRCEVGVVLPSQITRLRYYAIGFQGSI